MNISELMVNVKWSYRKLSWRRLSRLYKRQPRRTVIWCMAISAAIILWLYLLLSMSYMLFFYLNRYGTPGNFVLCVFLYLTLKPCAVVIIDRFYLGRYLNKRLLRQVETTGYAGIWSVLIIFMIYYMILTMLS